MMYAKRPKQKKEIDHHDLRPRSHVAREAVDGVGGAVVGGGRISPKTLRFL